jgi:LCP family protein required for cell wall assembly
MAKPSHRIPQIAITVVLGVCVVLGVALLVRLDILPGKMLGAVIALDVVVSAVIGFFLVRTPLPAKKARFTVLTILAVLAMVANLGVARVSNTTTNFGNNIQAPSTATVRYDIIGLTTGPSDASALKGTTMGELTTDPNAVAAEKAVTQMVPVSFTAFADPVALGDALTAGQISSGVLQDDYLDLYQENSPDFYATIKVIATFDIQVPNAPGQVTMPGATPSASDTSTPTSSQNPPGTFIVYISGIDTGGPISTRSRSDVNQLMVVNTNTGKIQLINTPRDYYVQLHGTTGINDKLTHAGIYGVDMSLQTMEDLYNGIDIDYYLRINFDSLTKVVDAVGGVDVNSPYAFTADIGGTSVNVVQGMNHFNGAQALAFSRDRHNVPGGDRGRGIDQQAVITALIQKMSQPATLMNFNNVLATMQNAMQTSMPMDVITSMVKSQLSSPVSWDISSYSVSGSDSSQYTYSYGMSQKLYVMIPYQSDLDTAEQKIKDTLNGS